MSLQRSGLGSARFRLARMHLFSLPVSGSFRSLPHSASGQEGGRVPAQTVHSNRVREIASPKDKSRRQDSVHAKQHMK